MVDTQKSIAVLGSTGSVGRQTLDAAFRVGAKVTEITGNKNWRLLETQSRATGAKKVWVSEEFYGDLKLALADTKTVVTTGGDGLNEIAYSTKSRLVFNCLLGSSGLIPALCALDGGHDIAISNKEALVEGGELITKKAREKGRKIIPVDSEHSAIFQCIAGESAVGGGSPIKKIYLTASGGAFYGRDTSYLKKVTPKMALCHPTWKMGDKITIDSSTLMNKGLEIIEAVWLFGVAPDDIEVLIHRESVVHSMVEFIDNNVKAVLSKPDMRLCAQYAITYPERLPSGVESLDFTNLGAITFSKPDTKTFPLLPLAVSAIKKGGNIPSAMSSANEEAVKGFLEGRLGFTGIFDIVAEVVEDTNFIKSPSLDDIIQTGISARNRVKQVLAALPRRS